MENVCVKWWSAGEGEEGTCCHTEEQLLARCHHQQFFVVSVYECARVCVCVYVYTCVHGRYMYGYGHVLQYKHVYVVYAQCVAVCCSVFVVYCSVLQCVAVCCSVFVVYCSVLQYKHVYVVYAHIYV